MRPRGKPVFTQEEADDRVRRAVLHDRARRQMIRSAVVHSEPQRLRNVETLLTVPGIFDHFVRVPPDFYTLEGKTAVIACPCGWADPEAPELRQHRIEFGGLLECPGCERWYFNGKVLYAAPPPEAE